MRVTTLFIVGAIGAIVFYGVVYVLGPLIGLIYAVSNKIDSYTSYFTNASVQSPFPTTFAPTISTYAAQFAIWTVAVVLVGLIIYLAFSPRR